MKIFLIALISGVLATSTVGMAQAGGPSPERGPQVSDRTMKITVGSRVFNAALEDNATVAALRVLLPLTLDMHDVNGNEKAFDLSARLPSADVSPRAIRNGDLMLWSSRTVVVFYKSFPTPYRYTRIGHIEAPAGLAAALGTGEATVKFELP